jgi:iron complex outermembrane receptor protein
VSGSTAPAPTANSQGMSTIDGKLMPSAPTMAAPVTTLAFNASYNISKNLLVQFDATNLTNVKRAYYRYSEAEQQKLDVSGRQYYVQLKYKF